VTATPHTALSRWRPAPQAGFTLVELVLVMFIIGMMLAVVFPKFRNIGGGDLKHETRTLIGNIQALYGEATFTRRLHRLVFDLEQDRYWAEVGVADGAGAVSFHPVAATFLKPVKLPLNIEINDVRAGSRGKRSMGTAYTYFHPLGRVDFTTIHMTQGDDDVMTLQVNPITGKVSLASGYVETVNG